MPFQVRVNDQPRPPSPCLHPLAHRDHRRRGLKPFADAVAIVNGEGDDDEYGND